MSFLNAMLDSFEDGRDEGRREGRELQLVELICKKLSKGKSIETIADELEEPMEHIKEICDVASTHAPDYDPEVILNEISTVKTD